MSSPLEIVERNLDEKTAARKVAWDELNDIPSRAVVEKDGLTVARALTTDEEARSVELEKTVVGLDSEIDALTARRSELQKMTERAIASAAQVPTMIVKQSTRESDIYADVDRHNMQNVPGATARDLAMRAVERSHEYRNDADKNRVMSTLERAMDEGEGSDAAIEKRNAVARLVVAASAPGYARAWQTAMTNPQMLSADQHGLLQRAMTSGTGSSGGYYVPTPVDPTFVLTGAGAYSPMRQVSTIKTTIGNTWKGATQAQTAAVVKGEGSAFTDETSTTTQVSIPVYTAGLYIPASYEAWQDIDNLAEDIGMLFADAAAILETTLFTTGSGSSTVTGVTIAVSVAGSTVTAITRSAFQSGDIFALNNALGARHRHGPNGVSFMSTINTINLIRQFGTALSYQYLTDLGSGQPPQLMGSALYENSAMTSTITTGTKLMVYGNFAKYYIVDKVGFQTEFIPNAVDGSGIPTGQRSVVGWWRVGGTAVDPDAFRFLLL